MRKIRFARRPGTADDQHADLIDVLVDGEPIQALIERQAGAGNGGAPLRVEWVTQSGHRAWLGEEPLWEELGGDDWALILRCVDLLTDCGGVRAKVEVTDQEVTWSDFRANPSGAKLPVAPLTFRRRQFESALNRLAEGK